MKRLISIPLAGALFAAAGLAQPSNMWREQWFKAKYGRYSPTEEARQRADRANAGAAFREDITTPNAVRYETAKPANSWQEQWFKAKFGRSSPTEEARQRADQANVGAAHREDTRLQPTPSTDSTAPVNSWREQWFKAKFGRYSPTEEARRTAEGLR